MRRLFPDRVASLQFTGSSQGQHLVSVFLCRWCNQLDPSVKKNAFDDLEDAIIAQVRGLRVSGIVFVCYASISI